MSSCVFCAIVAGAAPASVIWRDDCVWAFLDIAPLVPGHALVVPVGHAEGLRDLAPEAGMALFRVAQQVAGGLRRIDPGLGGVNLFLADGREAGQEILHVHLHVLPRRRGDGVRIDLGPVHRRHPDREELNEMAARLRAALPGEHDDGDRAREPPRR